MPLNDPATNKYASKDTSEGMNLPERQEYKEGYFGPEHYPDSPMQRFAYRVFRIWDRPVTWFRGECLRFHSGAESHSCRTESVVEPLQKRPPYYHMVFRRVPTIDQCYTDDLPCQYEAHEQYKRDRLVETKMVHILRKRYEDCLFYYGHDEAQKCFPLREEYRENELNWFIKCKHSGDFLESVLILFVLFCFSPFPIRRRHVVLQVMCGCLLQAGS